MSKYKSRPIKFKEIIGINGWKLKVYTITKGGSFHHPEFYKSVKENLPSWLSLKNSFNHDNDNIGFLILHSGNEGVFSIINWWVGENMLNTHIFFSDYQSNNNFKKISGDGLAPCVWELEVIYHEKKSWTKNVLKKLPDADYDNYILDTLNTEV